MVSWTAEDAPERRLSRLEGRDVDGRVEVRALARTDRMLVLQVDMAAGARSYPHRHAADSAGAIISGRVRAQVGDIAMILGPGDGFHHPEGVEHHVEALTDARWIEVKSPPVEPW